MVFGRAFGCFCLGKRLALGRGHLERTWARPKARAGGDGLEAKRRRRLNETPEARSADSSDPSVLQDAAKLWSRSPRLLAAHARCLDLHQLLIAEDRTFRLRLRTSRLSACQKGVKNASRRQRFVQRTQRTLTPPPRLNDERSS